MAARDDKRSFRTMLAAPAGIKVAARRIAILSGLTAAIPIMRSFWKLQQSARKDKDWALMWLLAAACTPAAGIASMIYFKLADIFQKRFI